MGFELICYLNFGYPTIESGLRYADMYIKSGCRALQVDLPTLDPYLEYKTIQDRMASCLARCDDYGAYMAGIAQIHRRTPHVKLVLMLYENIIETIGIDRLIGFCRENEICDLTYVGANPELRGKLEKNGLRIACYIQFHLPQEEIDFARTSSGIVLLQAKPAGKVKPGLKTFADCVHHLRQQGLQNPIYASVGVKTPQDITEIRTGGADGAFIGSCLMDALSDEALLRSTLTAFMQAADGRLSPG